ncbi:MAG: hypothetical protein N2Z22_07815 [Turneriella sp.]|nr:hypothetical protein [Leptospiraceae bacterium]MCX7633221.1 hypothetical protein [Turneriella sp.]
MPAFKDPQEELRKPIFWAATGDDEEEFEEEEEEEDDLGGEREIVISYACEDCDYRWEVYLEDEDDELDDVQYCPMCGSSNTTQI